jgi:hypothetical protein
MALET